MPRTVRNRLSEEPSLYLRQHAENPVDWHPWSDATLSRARAEDRPILLSVGYSACHWCHVMERECFEDERTASLMNEHFVCVKVDREERPDIDAVYMKAVQTMTGRGGWPMTVFLTPELLPFYAGTYFPPVDRGGLPGFPRVLRAVSAAYRSQRDRIRTTGERILQALQATADSESTQLNPDALLHASVGLAGTMDGELGGFGTAPKFPGATCLRFQIGVDSLRTDRERRRLIVTALDAMASGGVYDHLGGGFHRYSVDREWRVPHFEKMLYDQALMVDLYRDAWLAFRDPRYRETALGTLEYVRREMRSDGGAFFATQDADSEGHEGRFFAWSADEIRTVSGPRDSEIVFAHFGVTEDGDFEGGNVLRIDTPLEEVARSRGRDLGDVAAVVARVRRELLARRLLRVLPVTDRKILADWNGLMISAMAVAGRVFRRPDFVKTAGEAAEHALALLWPGSHLFHFHDEGVTRVEGFLDDYVFLGGALLDLYAATGRSRYFGAAVRCAEALLERFEDKQNGGFFFTSADAGTILHRDKDLHDGAVPSGNSVAADLLFRLHALTGDGCYEQAAERTIALAAASAMRNPYHGASLLAAALRRAIGYTTVVVFAPPGSTRLVDAALGVYAPGVTVLASTEAPTAADAPVMAVQRPHPDGREVAYVCRSGTCSSPVHTGRDLQESLAEVARCVV